ncbi:MAG: NmrA/HSCARG family protein [Saprospiraceae bacterium]
MKSIFVTGATGNQGGAAARSLASNGFKVKALVRDPSSSKAEALKKLDIELVKGDLDDPSSYVHHLKGVDGVFGVLAFPLSYEKEIMQGKALAIAAKENDIKHFIYSSVGFSDQKTGIPHFESKYLIEKNLIETWVPYTILRPVSFYENFQLPDVKKRILKGKFVAPLSKNTVQQIISAEDVGKVAAHIFQNPDAFRNRTLNLAAEKMDQGQMAETFADVLRINVKHQKLPGLITRLVMGKYLHAMFKYVNDHGGVFAPDFETVNKELPPMLTLREWIGTKFNQ